MYERFLCLFMVDLIGRLPIEVPLVKVFSYLAVPNIVLAITSPSKLAGDQGVEPWLDGLEPSVLP